MSTYLITGGTGSMGREMTKYLLSQDDVQKIIIYSRDEYKQAMMEKEFADLDTERKLRYFIGDIRDTQRLNYAVNGVDYVIHTAALKHVDKAEYNPQEYIKTNVTGSWNVIDACIHSGVKRCVMLSTDKAVSPINLYGATKLVAEKLFIASCVFKPIFSVVRYGNVINSRGSVIPYFKGLAESGAPTLPITHPQMTRFAMTFDMAVALVMQALGGMPQTIYIAKAPSFCILDLVKALGCVADIGEMRPGEKIHERLINEYEMARTYEYADHFEIAPENPWDDEVGWGADGRKLPGGIVYDSQFSGHVLSVSELLEMIERI